MDRPTRVYDEAARALIDDGCILQLDVHEIQTNGYIGLLQAFGCTVQELPQGEGSAHRIIFPDGTLFELDPEDEGMRYELVLPGCLRLIWVREPDKNTLIIPRQA